jgi:hypothetical protein
VAATLLLPGLRGVVVVAAQRPSRVLAAHW